MYDRGDDRVADRKTLAPYLLLGMCGTTFTSRSSLLWLKMHNEGFHTCTFLLLSSSDQRLYQHFEVTVLQQLCGLGGRTLNLHAFFFFFYFNISKLLPAATYFLTSYIHRCTFLVLSVLFRTYTYRRLAVNI